MTATEHVMTISGNGQVSIPAAARTRWGTRKVLVVDLGDRVVMRPAADADAVAKMQGKYANRGADTSAARRAARHVEDSAALRHR